MAPSTVTAIRRAIQISSAAHVVPAARMKGCICTKGTQDIQAGAASVLSEIACSV